MFKEQDLIKAATFYATRRTRYSNNLAEDKTFAHTALSEKKDYGPAHTTKLRMMTTTDNDMAHIVVTTGNSNYAKSYNPTKLLSSTMYQTTSIPDSKL